MHVATHNSLWVSFINWVIIGTYLNML